MTSLRSLEQEFRENIDQVTQKSLVAFTEAIVARSNEGKDDTTHQTKLLLRTALTRLKPDDLHWYGYYEEMQQWLSSLPTSAATQLLERELNHAYAEWSLTTIDSIITRYQKKQDTNVNDLYSLLSNIERFVQHTQIVQSKLTDTELAKKLSEEMDKATSIVISNISVIDYALKRKKDDKHPVTKHIQADADSIIQASLTILIKANDHKKTQEYIRRIGTSIILAISNNMEDEILSAQIREQAYIQYVRQIGFQEAYKECRFGKKITDEKKYYLALIVLRDYHNELANLTKTDQSFVTFTAPLIDIIGLESRNIIASLPKETGEALANYFPTALIKKLNSETDRCKRINYSELTRKNHKKGTQQTYNDLNALCQLLIETDQFEIKDAKINAERVDARQAAATIIQRNTSELAFELSNVTDKLNPDTIRAHAEEKVRKLPTTTTEGFTSSLAQRQAKKIKAKKETVADITAQRQLLIQTIQTTSATFLKLYDEKEIVNNTLNFIIKNTGIHNTYDIYLTHSDPYAKRVFADTLLHQPDYTDLNLEQIQNLVNTIAELNPEMVFHDIFMKNKQAKNDVETLANAILKSTYMLNWMLQKAPKKLDELHTLITSIAKHETVVNVFDHIAILEEDKPKNLQPGVGKELQLALLNHPLHRTALLNDNTHDPEQLKNAFKAWTMADFEAELKNPNYGNTMCWAMLCQPAIVSTLNKNKISALLRSIDFNALSSKKIALLHPTVIEAIFEQVAQNTWDHVKYRFTKEQMLALTTNFNLANIAGPIKNESLILFFAGKDLPSAVDALRNSKRKKTACVLLQELDTNGFWEPTTKKLNKKSIRHLVTMAIYQADNSYNLLDPQFNLSNNKLVRDTISENWSTLTNSFMNNADAKAFEFVISSPFILAGLDEKQIDDCVKTGAAKGMSTQYLLSTIESFEQRNIDDRQHAFKLLALIPEFLEGNTNFSDNEVKLKLKLITKYHDYLTRLHNNYDKTQVTRLLYNNVSHALRKKNDDKWKILGPLTVKDPELFGELISRYKDYKPKNSILGMAKYALVGGIVGAVGIGILNGLNSASLLPSVVTSLLSTFATAASYALGLGALASTVLTSFGLVAVAAIVLYAAKGPISRAASWLTRKFRHAVVGLSQTEKDQKTVEYAANYLDPRELRQACLINDETRHGLGKALLQWEDEDKVKINPNNKDAKQLLNGIKANERYDLLWEKGGFLGKAEYISLRILPMIVTLGLWYFMAESNSDLNIQKTKFRKENQSSPPSPHAALQAAGPASPRAGVKTASPETPSPSTSPQPDVVVAEKTNIAADKIASQHHRRPRLRR